MGQWIQIQDMEACKKRIFMGYTTELFMNVSKILTAKAGICLIAALSFKTSSSIASRIASRSAKSP